MKCSKCGLEIPRDSDSCTRCGTPILRKNITPTRQIHEDSAYDMDIYFSPGDAFGDRYKIVEEIGSGGMGKIFKAWDNELEIHVAIKMIRPELLAKSDTLARFKQEILIARKITHENVVRIYDFGEIKGVKFISMQYIDGENLADLIRTSGTFTSDTAINISKQICQGIIAAHKQDIIHRDLKPQNIMIDKNGKVFITDFGLAKSLEEPGLSMSGVVMGTPQYLSPEQAKGDKVDQQSDIYTLGIIMYEMITGKELFVSDTVIGYLQKHIQEKPPYPSTINALIPPFFEKIILKCLEKEKSRRYKNAEELLKDLQKEKVTSGPIFFYPRSRKIVKRFLISFLIVIAVAGLIYFLISTGAKTKTAGKPIKKDERKSLAVFCPEIISGDKKYEQLDETIQGFLITDLWQSPLLRVLSENRLDEILNELGQKNNNRIDEDLFPRIASRANVDYFVLGKYYPEPDTNRRFNLIIWEKEGSKFSRYPVTGDPGENVDDLVDKITRQIKTHFFPLESLSSDIDEDVGKITTTSTEAYRFYNIGKNHYWNSEYQESNEALEKAIALDPQFAMAYRCLATNYVDLCQFDKARKNIRKAIEFKDKASARERYLIQFGEDLILKHSHDKAIKTCQELLKQYPGDEEGAILLGSLYRNLEQWSRAEKHFKNILEDNKQSWSTNVNLIYIYLVQGRFDKARKLLQENRSLFSNRPIYHRYLARTFIYQHDYKNALAELNQSKTLSTNTLDEATIELFGQFYHLMGNLNEAERHYRQLMKIDDKSKSVKAGSHLSMCSLYLMQGKYARCRDEVNMGLEYCRENNLEINEVEFLLFSAYLALRTGNAAKALETAIQAENTASDVISSNAIYLKEFALHLKCYSYLQQKMIREATDTATRLRKLILETRMPANTRLYNHLMGLIYTAEEKFQLAIPYFEKTLVPMLPYLANDWDNQAFYFEPLAEAYYKAGKIDKAREYYEKIQSLTLCRLKWGDIYTRSFYMLGEIYRVKGNKKEAGKQYKKFLQLWKDADPDLQMLRDARERSAELGEATL